MKDRLKIHDSLTKVDLIHGLPIEMAALGWLFSLTLVGLSFKLCGFWFGLPLSCVFVYTVFQPLKWAHKDDPQAYIYWLKSLKTTIYSASIIKEKRVHICRGERVFSFSEWRNRNDDR
ncbi:conserved hypothetical protein [Vibrio nigripulchritudo FTn2]|uniref:hypothetical protein n=1 Tax=Vibrio nigripulchritudo TaxID=28173 RepID=UPI0003B1E279|nr:hypothetical protein [Vibrio nigripulchritudo]CCN39719.1 conserved hypothetical protein [Vibrio nigripulchritudo FTn2]